MQNLTKIILTSVVLLISHSALAEWYVGAEAIESRAIPNLDSLIDSTSLDLRQNEQSGISLIGGYRTNKFFSVQLEYQDEVAFGIDDVFAGSSLWFPETQSSDFESNALFLSGISSYPINESSSLYLKGGVFNWEVDSNLFDTNDEVLKESRGTDIFYGFGANYDLNARFEVSAEWERYQMEESDVDLLSTELKFKF